MSEAPDRSKAPETYEFGNLELPFVEPIRLDNGTTLFVINGGDQPVCRLSIHIDGGRAELGTAVGQLLVSQFAEGCENYSAEEIAELFDFNGARFAKRLVAHSIQLELGVLTPRLAALLPVLKDIICAPLFLPERLEVAKKRAIAVLRQNQADSSFVSEEVLNTLVHGCGHPFADRLTEENIEAVDSQTLKNRHLKLINPANIKAYLSGAFGKEEIDAVKNFLASIPAIGQGVERKIVPATPHEAPWIERVDYPQGFQQSISIGIPVIGRNHPDFIPLRLAVMALGGYFGSRLNMNIREEKGLTYGIHAWLSANIDNAYVCISARCDKSYTDTVLEEVKNELRALSDNPPSGEELRKLKLFEMSCLAEILDTPAAISSHYEMRDLVGTPENYFNEQQRITQALQPETIADIAKKYLDPDRILTVIAGV